MLVPQFRVSIKLVLDSPYGSFTDLLEMLHQKAAPPSIRKR
jgi:hypothetical protein